MSDETILTGGVARIRARWPAANAVRLTYVPCDADSFPTDRPWLEHVLLPQPEIQPDQARLQVTLSGGCVQVRPPEGDPILAELRPGDPRQHRLALRLNPGEGFYGWGEWFNAFRRGRGQVKLRAREALSLRQNRATYSAFPFFLSSQGYGFLLLNSYETTWKIALDKGELKMSAAGPPLDYVVIHGPSFKEILTTYTALTGRPPLPPRWAFGLWTTSYPQGHQDGVVEHVRQHRERDLPLDAVILDYHWEERFHNFQWRPALVPAPERLIAQLRAAGVRLGLIFTPFLNHHSLPLQKLGVQLLARDIPDGMVTADDRALDEYEEARDKGYLAHENARWWFGRGGMVDFAKPQAAAWWNAHLRRLYDQGVAFFKNDDGEYLPNDARSALGIDGREYHNLYGFFYGKATYEGMAEIDDRRPLIYARSVWAGSQRYPALFLGDQKPTFECIRRTMRAGLNMSLAGFAYWTADTFGLNGKTTPETHMRHAQWALLTPIARYFWRPPQVDATRFPWSHGPLAEASFRTYAQLRYRLLPYLYALAWTAWQAGLPILRPLALEFQDDPRLAAIYDQVMLGDRLMLAPVVEPGALRRTILLPHGTWHDFWSEQTWQGGGEIDYPAPLDRLPILVQGGTLLPMGPPLSHIPDDHHFDRLQLHLWPPYPVAQHPDRREWVEGVLYDDDGHSRGYQQGNYSVTRFIARGDQERLTVTVGAAVGRFLEQVERRRVEIILRRSAVPKQVQVGGRPLPGWDPHNPGAIELDCPVGTETAVEIAF